MFLNCLTSWISYTDSKFDVELPESSGTVGELGTAAANSNAVDEPPDELWCPDEGSEPNLDADLLYKLDRVADDGDTKIVVERCAQTCNCF